MTKITPCLWYDGAAEEAANFYVSLLPDSRIDKVVRAPSDNPSMQEGDVMLVEFTLGGMPFKAFNGGPQFKFNEAVSFVIHTEDQHETDRMWATLTAGGGRESQCGWLKDRWGVSWQIVPKRLLELFAHPDRDAARRVSDTMLTMRKIDMAVLERVAEGGSG